MESLNIPALIIDTFNNIRIKVQEILNRSEREPSPGDVDILDDNSDETREQIRVERSRKQRTMKYGEIWQCSIGEWPGYEDLGQGHPSGCDIRKIDNSEIIEVKNKYNTTNSSSREHLEQKLSQYKRENPNCECMWGIINARPNERHLRVNYTVNGFQITKLQGSEFLSHIFTYEDVDYSGEIVSLLKSLVHER